MSEEKYYENEKSLTKKDDEKKNPRIPPDILTEGITFITCPIHNYSYPKGSLCPKCEIQEKKDKNA